MTVLLVSYRHPPERIGISEAKKDFVFVATQSACMCVLGNFLSLLQSLGLLIPLKRRLSSYLVVAGLQTQNQAS